MFQIAQVCVFRIFGYHLRLFTIRKNIWNLKNYGGFIFQNNEKYAIFEEKGDFWDMTKSLWKFLKMVQITQNLAQR